MLEAGNELLYGLMISRVIAMLLDNVLCPPLCLL